MSDSFFSSHWYRVQQLRPALRNHVRTHRHHYRGERWYVLEDRVSGRQHRFPPVAYRVIGLMDGERTLQEIFELCAQQLGDDAPSQGEVIQLVARLHAADALRCDVPPDAGLVFQRFAKQQRTARLARWLNPLSLRFALWDPDAFLERWQHRARHVFTPVGLAIWALVVGLAVFQAGAHWRELSAPGLDAVLDPGNLLILLLTYPAMKLLHELGHAFAVKSFGGEVHELGLMLLVFVPMPYVDASAASSFADKRQRMLVGAAGVMVELFVAGLALGVWLHTAPGALHSIAWNAMLIGGASTLFFNGNPLLRYDGYHVLADALEIPNLSGRATTYLSQLFENLVLGLPERRPQHMAPGERAWLVSYGVAAFVYRLLLSIAIAFLVAKRFFVIGVGLALWSVALQTLLPGARALTRLRSDPRIAARTGRALAGVASLAIGTLLLLFAIPLPVWTTAQGVVWPPEHSEVRASADGFVREILVGHGTDVRAGDALLVLDDPLQRARLRVLEARERELVAQVAAARPLDRVELDIRREELASVRAELARERKRADKHVVRSPSIGSFVLPRADHLPGRFVRRGEALGYIANFAQPTVRAVISQTQIARVRSETRRAAVRLADRPGDAIPAQIVREVPAASSELPSMALGAAGGGSAAVDLRDEAGLTSVEKFFQVDLALAPGSHVHTIGAHVWVRFEHPPRPLAPLAFDSLRRLFMGRLGV